MNIKKKKGRKKKNFGLGRRPTSFVFFFILFHRRVVSCLRYDFIRVRANVRAFPPPSTYPLPAPLPCHSIWFDFEIDIKSCCIAPSTTAKRRAKLSNAFCPPSTPAHLYECTYVCTSRRNRIAISLRPPVASHSSCTASLIYFGRRLCDGEE